LASGSLREPRNENKILVPAYITATNHRARVSPHVLATALIALGAASLSTWPGPANALQPLNNVVVASVESNTGTDFVLTFANNDADEGQVVLFELTDRPDARWNFVPSGEDPYYFISRAGNGQQELAEQNCNNDFCQVVVAECNPTGIPHCPLSPDDFKWKLVQVGSASKIINKEHGVVLDIRGNNLRNGAEIITFHDNGQPNQKWVVK